MKNPIPMKTPVLCLAVGLATASALSAGLVYSETFESITAGTSTAPNADWTQWSSGGSASITVDTDSADLFGRGTSNKALELSVFGSGLAGATLNAGVDALSGGVGTFSFELASDFTTDANEVRFDANIGDGDGSGSVDRATILELQRDSGSGVNADINVGYGPNGTERSGGTITENTAYRFDIVFNESGSPITVSGQNINNGEHLLFKDGVAVASDVNNRRSILDAVEFEAPNGSWDQDTWIDNIGFFDSAEVGTAVPEPSAFTLIGGLLAARLRAAFFLT